MPLQGGGGQATVQHSTVQHSEGLDLEGEGPVFGSEEMAVQILAPGGLDLDGDGKLTAVRSRVD